jgi:hypothetical protein
MWIPQISIGPNRDLTLTAAIPGQIMDISRLTSPIWLVQDNSSFTLSQFSFYQATTFNETNVLLAQAVGKNVTLTYSYITQFVAPSVSITDIVSELQDLGATVGQVSPLLYSVDTGAAGIRFPGQDGFVVFQGFRIFLQKETEVANEDQLQVALSLSNNRYIVLTQDIVLESWTTILVLQWPVTMYTTNVQRRDLQLAVDLGVLVHGERVDVQVLVHTGRRGVHVGRQQLGRGRGTILGAVAAKRLVRRHCLLNTQHKDSNPVPRTKFYY